MLSFNLTCRRLAAVIPLLAASSLLNAQPASAPASAPAKPSALYQRIAGEFLDSKWDELETDLAANAKDLANLAGAEKTDLAYIRQALADGRPAWWKTSKAGQKFQFQPVVWGHPLHATFDPASQGLQWKSTGAVFDITVAWKSAEMDDTSQAEHGFTKGELCHLGIWMTLGMAHCATTIPPESQINLKDDGKLLIQRYLDFRADVTGVYYGSPRARRWGLWLWMAGFTEHYSKMPIVMCRQAVGAMFVAEVVSHADKYPSIRLPKDLPADGAETKLAAALSGCIEKQPWTLAEDRSIREALKAFAAANEITVRQTGKVTLPNGLFVSLDPQADATNRSKRDAWVKAQFDKIAR